MEEVPEPEPEKKDSPLLSLLLIGAVVLAEMCIRDRDTDLLGVDEDYTALENELAQTVANIESCLLYTSTAKDIVNSKHD